MCYLMFVLFMRSMWLMFAIAIVMMLLSCGVCCVAHDVWCASVKAVVGNYRVGYAYDDVMRDCVDDVVIVYVCGAMYVVYDVACVDDDAVVVVDVVDNCVNVVVCVRA